MPKWNLKKFSTRYSNFDAQLVLYHEGSGDAVEKNGCSLSCSVSLPL